jgi:acyl-CoA thioesterase
VAAQHSIGHAFDEALALVEVPASALSGRDATRRWQGQTQPGYRNMVGPFGGLTAAQALHAVLKHPQLLGQPISLTVNFAAAVADGVFYADALPVRTNRSTQHWQVQLKQVDASGAEQVVTTATAITATRRPTYRSSDMALPSVPRPAEVVAAPREGRPTWLNNYDVRCIAGDIPMQWDGAESESLTRQWLRDEPPRPLDYCSLTAFADVFYPRIWGRRAKLTPAGTVSLTVYYHADSEELANTGTGYLLGQARGQRFFDGYFDQTAQLWNEAGALLATTHQIVYFKD